MTSDKSVDKLCSCEDMPACCVSHICMSKYLFCYSVCDIMAVTYFISPSLKLFHQQARLIRVFLHFHPQWICWNKQYERCNMIPQMEIQMFAQKICTAFLMRTVHGECFSRLDPSGRLLWASLSEEGVCLCFIIEVNKELSLLQPCN